MDIHKISVDLGLESLGLGVVRIVTPFTSMQCISIWSLFEAGNSLDRNLTVANLRQNPKTRHKKGSVGFFLQHWQWLLFTTSIWQQKCKGFFIMKKIMIQDADAGDDDDYDALGDRCCCCCKLQLMLLLLHACKASAGKTTIVAALSHLGFRPWIQCFVLFVM